ncbi:EamA family transporter [Actinopolyspora mortivallis]|uniref:EamA family transporter n=2 Tax=Actinopolyspora mortivallis TaxID=33906 RepID=A0A2T0GXJ9_ACTMO|nr:EamA family transporter [Actinopolyspora mortivallis]
MAVASAFCFGGSGPVAKALINAGLGPLQVTWLRLAGGALLMLPFAIRHFDIPRRAPRLLLGYGLIAIAGVQGFYFVAVAKIPVGVALLIEFLAPVLVLGWTRFVRRRPVARSSAVGVVIAVVGLAAVVEVWAGLTLDPVGILLAFGAACCQAAFFLLADTGGEVDPRALASYGLLIATGVITAVVAPWTIDWSVLGGRIELAGQAVPALFGVGWIVLFSCVFAYLTGILAVRKLSAPVAGAIAYLEPVVATVLAWWLLSEHLGAVQIVGGVLVLLGAYAAQRRTSENNERVSEPVAEPM